MGTLITKAFRQALGNTRTVKKAARGVLGDWVPEQGYGQPLPLVATNDTAGLVTPERMREIVLKTPTLAAAHNATMDYAGGVPILPRHIDPSKKLSERKQNVLKRFLQRPNPEMSGRHFKLAILKDLFTLGFAAAEIEDRGNPEDAYIWPVDAANLKIDYDEHGTVTEYFMWDKYQRKISWSPDEIIFFSLNPMTNNVYPYSRVTQLFACAVIEDLMLHFIGTKFTDSNIPFGIMDLGDISDTELRVAISNWNMQAKEQHKILLTGSKGGANFIPFGYHLKDLEASVLLDEVRKKIMGVVGTTMNELGESQDVNKSNGYNLSFTFKKRSIEPLLNEYTETYTRRVVYQFLGYEDAEYAYDQIDSRDDLIQAQIDETYMKMGVLSINQIRKRRGDPAIDGGDVFYVSTGNSWVPVDMLETLAQTMVQGIMTQGATAIAPDGTNSVHLHLGPKNTGAAGQTPNKIGPGEANGQKPQGIVHAQRLASGSKK